MLQNHKHARTHTHTSLFLYRYSSWCSKGRIISFFLMINVGVIISHFPPNISMGKSFPAMENLGKSLAILKLNLIIPFVNVWIKHGLTLALTTLTVVVYIVCYRAKPSIQSLPFGGWLGGPSHVMSSWAVTIIINYILYMIYYNSYFYTLRVCSFAKFID